MRSIALRYLAFSVLATLLASGCAPIKSKVKQEPEVKNDKVSKVKAAAKLSPQEQESAAEQVAGDGRVSIVYSPDYLISLGGLERLHSFDIHKYRKIHAALLADKLLTRQQTLDPQAITDEDILLVQSQDFLDSLHDKDQIIAYLEAEPLRVLPKWMIRSRVLKPFRRASGGTLLAARQALEHGVAVNLGGGYHHAKIDVGEGFCVFADVPIAIRRLQKENKIQRALIIDVDAHQGNGTTVCLAGDESTYTFSMHQGDIYPTPKETSDWDIELEAGTTDETFMTILNAALPKLFERSQPDIVFIVGGCDTLQGDPLAELAMTEEGIVRRDMAIVAASVERNVPVVLTLAGGYSPNAWRAQYRSIKAIIEAYGMAGKAAE